MPATNVAYGVSSTFSSAHGSSHCPSRPQADRQTSIHTDASEYIQTSVPSLGDLTLKVTHLSATHSLSHRDPQTRASYPTPGARVLALWVRVHLPPGKDAPGSLRGFLGILTERRSTHRNLHLQYWGVRDRDARRRSSALLGRAEKLRSPFPGPSSPAPALLSAP